MLLLYIWKILKTIISGKFELIKNLKIQTQCNQKFAYPIGFYHSLSKTSMKLPILRF